MNTRRSLVIALGAAGSFARALFAQVKKQPALIGWLNSGSRESNAWQLAAFKEGLAALGYKEGHQFVIEERWADARIERLPLLAQELAAMKPAVFVASAAHARAALRARHLTKR